MIIKNEEDVLARCLDSVKAIADEIIVVDTGSTDSSKSIALRYTDLVFDFEWVDDFAKARNFSFSKASKEYIMWLDADDIVDHINIQKILILKNELAKNIDFVYLKYDIAFDEMRKSTFSYYRERIVRNCEFAIWIEPIHEVIAPFGNTHFCDASVSHKKLQPSPKGRNLKILEKNKGNLSPRLKYYYARELMYNGFERKAEKAFESFLKEKNAFIENKIDALRKLYFLQRKRGVNNLSTLFKTFELALPKAEIVCDIGGFFLDEKKYVLAEYWYQLALKLEKHSNTLGFVESDYYDFIPLMQLCVVYDKLGKRELAVHYNDLAGKVKPNHPSYIHNLKYFLK